ncbi:hypothetical protein EDC04DRAFT_2609172 [Pisolithus marmoratus]|nr:hypothetical protein EDC04DRAFT_2609172 [Pisolithus marmoratus]
MFTVVAGHQFFYSHPSFTPVDKPVPVTSSTTGPVKSSLLQKLCKCVIQDPSGSNLPHLESFNDILKHLISPEVDASATDAEIMSFNGVTAQEFEAISHIVQESPLFPMKPKLIHDPQLSVIIMEWLKATHEVPLTDFRDKLNSAVQNLPFDRWLLQVALETNFSIQSSQTRFSGIPDLSLTLMSMTSSNLDLLKDKVRKEIAVYPEVVLVIMILIKEAPNYHSPAEGSAAWNQFPKQNWLDEEAFLSLKHSDINSDKCDHPHGANFTLKPVIVTKHCWCNITSAKYCIWVKNDIDQRIDIDEHEMTSGVNCIPGDSKNLQANADMHALEKAEISLTIDWGVIQQESFEVHNTSHCGISFDPTLMFFDYRATQQVPLGAQDAPTVLEATAVVPLPTPGTSCPIHNHCLPRHYHDDVAGTAQDSDEGENINIHVNSDDPVATWPSGPHHLTQQKAKNDMYDIHHFFKKEEEYALCLPCVTPSSKGGGGLSVDDSYFSGKTSNTMLHNHLESVHTLLYINKLEEEGWLVQSKLLKATFSSGYTFNTLRAALALPDVTIDNLPPPPPPKGRHQ